MTVVKRDILVACDAIGIYPPSIVSAQTLVVNSGDTEQTIAGSAFTPALQHEPIDVKFFIDGVPLEGITWRYVFNDIQWDIKIQHIFTELTNVKIIAI